MKIITKASPAGIVNNLTTHIMTEHTAMFDIETTGFHRDRTMLYLIGAGRLVGSDFEITQFFADSRADEQAVLEAFLDYLSENEIKTLISYNGLMFDVPYINHKLMAHGMDADMLSYEHIDIYKIVSAQKSLFKLPNYKQKSVEAFLGIHRDDEYNGGQLIPVYEAYTRSQNEELLSLLLLHNYEDVLGMLDLLPALSYSYNLSGGSFLSLHDAKLSEDCLTLMFDLEYPVPKSLYYEGSTLFLSYKKDRASIAIPVKTGEYRLFYPDYKNYYYFPEEDAAYHRDVAVFTDSSHRVRATKDTAYTRVSGQFIPSFGLLSEPVFHRKTLKDEALIKIDGADLAGAVWMPEYLRLVRNRILSLGKL